MLRMIRTPESGGDTIFTSQTALYDKLSPTFRRLFDGLHGVHSSEVRVRITKTRIVSERAIAHLH